jgi:nucleotide-binding universal stress UspA family protein
MSLAAPASRELVMKLRDVMSTDAELVALERAVAAQAGIAAGSVDPTPVIEEQRREATHYLERVGERLINCGLSVVCKQPEGSASESILEHAQASNADLIALTTHGRGDLGRAVFGSVADDVLRRVACPVLLVRVTEENGA